MQLLQIKEKRLQQLAMSLINHSDEIDNPSVYVTKKNYGFLS